LDKVDGKTEFTSHSGSDESFMDLPSDWKTNVIDRESRLGDIRDLAGTQSEEIELFGGSARYSKFTNSDFGLIKGAIFTFTKKTMALCISSTS